MAPHEPIWEIIARRARETPQRNLIVEADGSTVTYGDARQIVLGWAAVLDDQLGRDARRVGVVLPNDASPYLLRLACGQAGITFLALNPLLKGHLLRDAIVRAAVTDLVVSRETEDSVTAACAGLAAGPAVHRLDGRTFLPRTGDSGAREKLAGRPGCGQVVLYTSGTTGPAKPVRLTSATVQSYARTLFGDEEPEWAPDAGYYSPWHPAHVLGAVALDVAVVRGLALVLRRKFSRSHFWSDIVAHHCEATTLVTVADDIWAHREPGQAGNPMKVVGMSPLVGNVRDFERYFGVTVVSVYGMTELGNVLTARSPADSRITGWPVQGYQVRLVDVPGIGVETSRAGRVGELVVRPDQVTSEYELEGEAVTRAWRDGWFYTGDLFTEFEGAYTFIGRIKDSIRRHSRNISAADLEDAIRLLDGVADCACVGVSPPDAGGRPAADDEIRVFVVAQPGAVIDPGPFLARLAERLPAFMLPRYLDVVRDLPHTLSGKVSRQALRTVPIGPATYDRKGVLDVPSAEGALLSWSPGGHP